MAEPVTKLPTHMTVAEFLAWDRASSQNRVQLIDGEVRAQMSPATAAHGAIQAEAARLIGNHLAAAGARTCRVITEAAVQPRARADFNLRVPDLAVTCTASGPSDVLVRDPIVIVEILSPGNAAETWANVWAYTTIPSVREILIVSSFEIAAQFLKRGDDGHWPKDPVALGDGDTLDLATIGLSLPLRDIFAQTHLVEESE
jgi:Uma2 family endonuclease